MTRRKPGISDLGKVSKEETLSQKISGQPLGKMIAFLDKEEAGPLTPLSPPSGVEPLC